MLYLFGLFILAGRCITMDNIDINIFHFIIYHLSFLYSLINSSKEISIPTIFNKSFRSLYRFSSITSNSCPFCNITYTIDNESPNLFLDSSRKAIYDSISTHTMLIIFFTYMPTSSRIFRFYVPFSYSFFTFIIKSFRIC
jgi:hypothetical protein